MAVVDVAIFASLLPLLQMKSSLLFLWGWSLLLLMLSSWLLFLWVSYYYCKCHCYFCELLIPLLTLSLLLFLWVGYYGCKCWQCCYFLWIVTPVIVLCCCCCHCCYFCMLWFLIHLLLHLLKKNSRVNRKTCRIVNNLRHLVKCSGWCGCHGKTP